MRSLKSPDDLKLYKRFDVFIKLIYARQFINGSLNEWEKNAYLEHINVFNGFLEPGQNNKNSQSKFIDTFNSIIKSMQKNGYSSNFGNIPLSISNVPQDGSHRLSSAIALGLNVYTDNQSSNNFIYDFKFFKKNGLDQKIMDAAALEFINHDKNSCIFIVYPTSNKHLNDIENLFESKTKLFYCKKVTLSSLGAINTIHTLYKNESWLGDHDNDFYGMRSKAFECFGNNGGTVSIFLTSSTPKVSLEIKNNIREIVQKGKHSIHSTDSHYEAKIVGQLFFNFNSIDYINNSRPNIHENQLLDFKDWLKKDDINTESICITGSSVLELYGLRKSKDIDFIHLTDIDSFNEKLNYGSHNKDSFMFSLTISEIINNPSNHFYANGFKYVTLDLLKKFKHARNEAKDIEDIKLINSVSRIKTTSKNNLKLKYKMRIIARRAKLKLKFYLNKVR